MEELNKNGFAVIHDVLSSKECSCILDHLSNWKIGRSRAGTRHLMTCPAVSSLANDRRLIALASTALSEPAIPYRTTLFEKSPKSNWLVVWHQDTALPLSKKIAESEWGPWSCKAGVMYAHAPSWALEKVVTLRVHLDPCAPENGPLRVISGSHQNGALTDDEIGAITKTQASIECVVSAGGVLLMKPLIIHASSKSKSKTPRRILHIEYAPQSGIGTGIDLAVA
jgi:ectoine hydroxylase-related dioxygenase (phytanoyl-CoA dioxygenase family)